ncbi:PIN-like domain-containing protein [Streptosporangium lutulentum]
MRILLTSGLVVFDTNPLLDTYKLTGTARTEFLDALRALGDRLWIPDQVGLEFMRNRATVIGHGSGFSDKFREAAGDLHKEVQRLKEHRGLKDDEVNGIKKAIDDAITGILDVHADLYAFEVDPAIAVNDDPIFKEIELITAGKVGPPFSRPDEVEAKKIGTQRINDKIPPGYSDVRDKGVEGALGDYFMWEQTLIEAERRGLPVLLVTNENKEDWVRKEGSYTRGPRIELVNEMLARTGQTFHLMNVKSFLFHAGKYLRTHVSESTIEQAGSVQKQSEFHEFSFIERLLSNQLNLSRMARKLISTMSQEQRVALLRMVEGGEPYLVNAGHDFQHFMATLNTLGVDNIAITAVGDRFVIYNTAWTGNATKWAIGQDMLFGDDKLWEAMVNEETAQRAVSKRERLKNRLDGPDE